MKVVITVQDWRRKQELAESVLMNEPEADALHYEEIAKDLAKNAGKDAGYVSITCLEDDFDGEDKKIIDTLTLTWREWEL